MSCEHTSGKLSRKTFSAARTTKYRRRNERSGQLMSSLGALGFVNIAKSFPRLVARHPEPHDATRSTVKDVRSHADLLLESVSALAAADMRAEFSHKRLRARYMRAMHNTMCAGASMREIARRSCIATGLPLTEIGAEEARLTKALSVYRRRRQLTPCGHRSRKITRITVEELCDSEADDR